MYEREMFIFNYRIWFVFPSLFWDWDVEMFFDIPVDYSADAVMSFCLQLLRHLFFYIPKGGDWYFLFLPHKTCIMSDWLNPTILLKAFYLCPLSWPFIMSCSPSQLIWPILSHSNEPSFKILILSSSFTNFPALLALCHLSACTVSANISFYCFPGCFFFAIIGAVFLSVSFYCHRIVCWAFHILC